MMLLLTDQTLKRQLERQWAEKPLRSANSYVGWAFNLDRQLVAVSFRRVPRWYRQPLKYSFPKLRWRKASRKSEADIRRHLSSFTPKRCLETVTVP